jgi:uncharacterized protein (TIGR00299 family) protein
MRVLYFETNSGASGDMINAALYDLLSEEQQQDYIKTMNSLFVDKVDAKADIVDKFGIIGKKISFEIDGVEESAETVAGKHHHYHTSYKDVKEIIGGFNIEEKIKDDALAVYSILARAESKVHGTEIEEIHFHEVGHLDAICDITGASYLVNQLGVDRIISTPVPTGFGTVKCAHGILPVPAPATAEILKGMVSYQGNVESEMLTPTGAAILKHFVADFGERPIGRIEKIGIGMGTKTFLDSSNMLRSFLIEV